MQSSEWWIVCTFESSDHQIYTIQRIITKTKTGESIKSKLFFSSIPQSTTSEKGEILSDMSSIGLYYSWPDYGDEIVFKNESDLQANLNDLLPPYEVFMGTQMLMQDSINIFELEPKERLEIFKHVFNLTGVDSAKDTIAEHKRDLNAMIKARSDLSLLTSKVHNHIDNLILLRDDIKTSHIQQHNTDSLSSRQQTIDERSLLRDKITIDLLSLPEDSINLDQYIANIRTIQNQRITIQTQITSIEWQIQHIKQEQQQLTNQQKTIRQEMEQNKGKINAYDPNKLDQINQSLQEISTQREQLQQQIDRQQITQHSDTLIQSLQDPDIIATIVSATRQENQTLLWFFGLLQQLKQIAKDSTHHSTLIQQQRDHTTEQHRALQEQLTKAEQRLASFQHDLSQQKLFHCEKIQSQCPYIDLINTKTFQQLHKQEDQLLQERDEIKQKSEKFVSNEPSDHESLAMHQQTIAALKVFFTAVEWKTIEELVQRYQTITLHYDKLQSEWSSLHHQTQQITDIQDKITQFESTLSSLEWQSQLLDQQLIQHNETSQKLQSEINLLPSTQQLQREHDQIITYGNHITALRQIISDFKTNQREVQQLQEQEKIVSDLYQIFAKELLLIVVQKNLPVLQDAMNSYLSQVVDYQLQMEIDKKSANSDNIDLLVTIIDQRWSREVKSLSWGQRIILKIVWMMAIAYITRSQMLFLDETINNLDNDTVAKVAELLKNFVEGKWPNFKFYVVTHSHQIQEMGIWDQVIVIE